MRLLLAAFLLLVAAPAGAQAAGPRFYVGGGLYPGAGGMAGVSRPLLTIVAQEAAVYADYQPRVLGGAGRRLVAVGAGGSLRAARLLGVARGADQGGADLDLGVRIGPAFYYAFFEQTGEAEARSFRVMFDPFARATLDLGGRTVFAEFGGQAPQLRAGLAF
ncbi:MAG TPA: hypothetical protein VK610_01095 [Rhodothermales bacterium]|nr:hypothetical protein [Rhodothermales bacterium]